MTTALLLVDIQNDYFAGGKMELEGSMQAGHNAGKILAHFRKNGLSRIHVQHVSGRPDAQPPPLRRPSDAKYTRA